MNSQRISDTDQAQRQGAWAAGSDPLSLQTWNAVQRLVFLWLGPLGAVACVAALATQGSHVDSFDRVALPLLAAVLLVMTAVLARNVLNVVVVTRVAFVATSLYFLLGFDHQFYGFFRNHQMLSESSYWFAVLYATAFIAFQSRQAIQVCAAIFVCSLLICGVQLLDLGIQGLLSDRMVASVVQFLMSSLVLVLAQFAVGRLRQQLDQVRAAAYLDVLTGLPNRRYGQQQLEHMVQGGRAFSLVMLDIDHFKRVNDTYGHQAGDLVLRETGRVIGRHLSSNQFLARWGGEEFVMVLPGLHKQGGKKLAEAARQDLYQHVFDQVGGLTASFGVAEWVPGDDLETVMRRADAALYAAKRQGRNGVRVAMEDGRLTRLDLPDPDPDARTDSGGLRIQARTEAPPNPQQGKALWREWARLRRSQLPPPDAAAICLNLLAFLQAQGIHTALAYHALPGEVDLSALAPHLRLYTTRAVFRPEPRLTLHDWHAATEVSRFGARQPPRGTPEVERREVGAVLLPGLAFDHRGWRLGYGGGFYDRLLAGWEVLSVGVTAQALWLPELPHEAHDLPVGFVATELGVQAVERD